jgi:monovalent cation:H+ antiporter, CPA1 family
MDVARIEILLLIACVVAILARRVKLPYTVGLVFAGVGMAFFNAWPSVPISRDVIFNTLLPPLVFEAAFAIRWPRFKRDIALITWMATFGVFVAIAVVWWGMMALAGWDWKISLIFASLIAATDPVSVIAMLKEQRVGGRFKLLIEAESLMNDGTGAAMFAIALTTLAGSTFGFGDAAATFLLVSVGGLMIGAATGFICTWLMGRVSDHLVEITLSVVAAWGSFLLAEHFGLSGILASVAAGLVIGNYGPLAGMSAKGRDDAETFWEFAAFVANSLVFLMVGVKLANQNYDGLWLEVLCAIPLVLFGRALAVFGSCIFFSKSKLMVPKRQQALLFWGGLRGALALSLALTIPEDTPRFHHIIGITFAVVAFSVIVQGITIGPLIRKAHLPVPSEGE